MLFKIHIESLIIRINEIDADGAAKLGEGVSNLLNLTTLNLNLWLKMYTYRNI
jgi:hypothetical protein